MNYVKTLLILPALAAVSAVWALEDRSWILVGSNSDLSAALLLDTMNVKRDGDIPSVWEVSLGGERFRGSWAILVADSRTHLSAKLNPAGNQSAPFLRAITEAVRKVQRDTSYRVEYKCSREMVRYSRHYDDTFSPCSDIAPDTMDAAAEKYLCRATEPHASSTGQADRQV